LPYGYITLFVLFEMLLPDCFLAVVPSLKCAGGSNGAVYGDSVGDSSFYSGARI